MTSITTFGSSRAIRAVAILGLFGCSILGTAGCQDSTGHAGGAGRPLERSSGSASPSASTSRPASPPASPAPSGSANAGTSPLQGKVITLDAGHNTGNYGHADEIAKPVPAGPDMQKECDTTGTETDAGYKESAFTFDVVSRLAAVLKQRGATVVLTRTDDNSVGPCVDKRAEIGNQAHAAAALSIHADGGGPDGRGFHVMEPKSIPGYTEPIVEPSHRLALAVRDAYRAGTGMPTSNYIGTDGINPRDDMGGLNLSKVPKVMLETGNMRNSTDAGLLSDAGFRQRTAVALATALENFLKSKS